MVEKPIPLSRREREIMDVLYAIGTDASVEDIRGRLHDPPTYSAVRAMMVKLEAKGSVRHREDGPRYLYAPTTKRTSAQRSAVQRLVDVFFHGSPGTAAAALLKHEDWTAEELDALSAEIAEARKQVKPK